MLSAGQEPVPERGGFDQAQPQMPRTNQDPHSAVQTSLPNLTTLLAGLTRMASAILLVGLEIMKPQIN